MTGFETSAKDDQTGTLDGQFLIAMPGMEDERFHRAVIYLCAHSADGAMGLIINRARDIRFPDLLAQIGLIEEDEAIRLPESAHELLVRNGGPVERGRGFVLHSDDYVTESSLRIEEHIFLTATVEILREISLGNGPRLAFMALGYSGWGPGQLEAEIAANGWLTLPSDPRILFDTDLDRIYERALACFGIDPAHLSAEAGHA